ncbi:MAG TPA: hypothetical protein VMW01_16860 [Williamwhitmania sp.]|nr:hypothetical protein [Williamwhitmania sp.]
MNSKSLPDNLDQLIDQALSAAPEFDIPASFADRVVARIERQIAWRQLLLDFGLKVLVVVGVLIVLGGTLFWANMDKSLQSIEWLSFFTHNLVPIGEVVLATFFTFFVDQVVLKYFMHRRSSIQL